MFPVAFTVLLYSVCVCVCVSHLPTVTDPIALTFPAAFGKNLSYSASDADTIHSQQQQWYSSVTLVTETCGAYCDLLEQVYITLAHRLWQWRRKLEINVSSSSHTGTHKHTVPSPRLAPCLVWRANLNLTVNWTSFKFWMWIVDRSLNPPLNHGDQMRAILFA